MNLRQLNQNTSKEASGKDSEKTTLIRFIQFTQLTPLRILTRKEPSSLIKTFLEAGCFYGVLYAGFKYTGINKKFEGMTTKISKSFHHPTEIILATFSIIHALAKSCSNKNTTIAIEEDRESSSKGGESEEKKYHKSMSPPIHSAGNPHAERKEVKSLGHDIEKPPESDNKSNANAKKNERNNNIVRNKVRIPKRSHSLFNKNKKPTLSSKAADNKSDGNKKNKEENEWD
jgi:hypothetical protein